MRRPKYLSPTSISLFLQDREAFYLKYLAEQRPPRELQTPAMAVGSAFDAYVKNYLHDALFGIGSDPRFEFNTLFEAQVEEQNRPEAREAGGWCFEWYLRLGAIADLLLDLQQAIGKPRFEIDLRGTITTSGELEGVPFIGRPDCFFVSKDGGHVVLDWKVNGFYSKSPPSPMQGYIKLRDDGKLPSSHGKLKLEWKCGIAVNTATTLEAENPDWARQLTIYSAQTGQEIGEPFIARIEQVVCNTKTSQFRPKIRVASHSLQVSSSFQKEIFNVAKDIWNLLQAPDAQARLFPALAPEDSVKHCESLERRAETLYGSGVKDDNDVWFTRMLSR